MPRKIINESSISDTLNTTILECIKRNVPDGKELIILRSRYNNKTPLLTRMNDVCNQIVRQIYGKNNLSEILGKSQSGNVRIRANKNNFIAICFPTLYEGEKISNSNRISIFKIKKYIDNIVEHARGPNEKPRILIMYFNE